MGTATGSLANIYNWPASLNVTLGTGVYPNGTLTFTHNTGVIENAVWKDNTGTRHTYTLCLCDSAGNNRVALSPTLAIGPSSLVYNNTFTASNGTALAGKALYIVPLRDGAVCSDKFAFKTNSSVSITTADQTWTLTTAVSPSGYGSVTAGGAMAYNAKKQLVATPGTGRYFSSWSKTAGTLSTTTAATTTFTMGTSAATVTANFGTNNYTLTVSKGTGISSVSGGGSKAYGSSNAISATASTGYTFKNWTSNNGGSFANANSASTNFTMPAGNVTVTANATLNSYTLTVNKGTGVASVTGGGSKGYNTSNAISATMSTGYSFVNWTTSSGGSFANANSASTNYTMPNNAATVTANGKLNSYTLTTSVSPSGGGSATAGGSMGYNTKKKLVATASTGYTFSSWSKTAGTLSTTTAATTTFTMGTSAATVTANFTLNSYTLTTAVSPSGGGSVTAGSSMGYNTKKQLVATASTGYTFSSWSKTAGTLSTTTAATTTFTMGAGAATVTANFTLNSYTLTTSVSPSGGGSVTAGGSQGYNTKKQLVATPATGYSFSSWTKTACTLSTTSAATTTFTMPNSAATVTANFTLNSYTLTTAVSPTGGGTVTAGGSMGYNTTKQLVATASTGYSFSSWSNTAGTLSTTSAATTTFTIGASAATVTANFTHNTYTLSSAVSPSGGGSVTLGAASGYYNDSISISAAPSTGYSFASWSTTSGTIADATQSETTITMPASDTTVTASFEKIDYSITTQSDPQGAGTVTADVSTANYGDTVTLSQTPATGYAFDGYTTSPEVTITNDQFTMPASNITITGNYHISKSTCSLDESSYTGGDTAVLSINIASQDFTHRYKLSFGNGMETDWVSLAAGVDTANIYIPVAWSTKLKGSTSATGGTLQLETYDNGSLLGTDVIENLTYTALDSTIPSLEVWRCDENDDPDILGQYIGYSTTIPSSITVYEVTHDAEPLSVDSNHNVTLSMTYGNETFTIVKDIPKVIAVKKLFM
jgi:uncharacterized repeat protein (TIGR02543 family)